MTEVHSIGKLNQNYESKMIQIPVKELNDFFTCFLCHGYFQQANTIPDCLHTFCRVCIIRYVLKHSNSSNIPCPRCEMDLGTYSQITKKVKHDRNLQVICDALFPQEISNDRGSGGESEGEGRKLKRHKSQESEQMNEDGDDKKADEGEDEEDVEKEEEEDEPEVKKKSKNAAAAKAATTKEPAKKATVLPPKSLHNILGHKLLAGALQFKSAEVVPPESSSSGNNGTSKKRKSDAEESNQTKSRVEEEDKEDKEKARKKAKTSSTSKDQPIEHNKKNTAPATEVPVTSTAKETQADAAAKASSGKDYLIKLAPDESTIELTLPSLPKPNFHSALKVLVSQIQSFVLKRLPEEAKINLPASNIDVLYDGKSILHWTDLSPLQEELSEKVVPLTYRRLI